MRSCRPAAPRASSCATNGSTRPGSGAESDGALRTLVARRAGELVGAMPLVRTLRPSRTGRRRVLEFLTVPDTQFCDILAPIADAAAVAESFAGALAARGSEWDVLELGYLQEDATAVTAFADALRRSGCTVVIEPAGSNPYIALGSTWDAYYGARSRSLKKASNLALNRVAKSGEPKIDWHRPATGETEALLAKLIDVSSRSWKRTTGNSLDQAGPQAFIRRLTELAAERQWLSVWTLALDGKPIAMEYQLVFGGQVHALRSDFDAGLRRDLARLVPEPRAARAPVLGRVRALLHGPRRQRLQAALGRRFIAAAEAHRLLALAARPPRRAGRSAPQAARPRGPGPHKAAADSAN